MQLTLNNSQVATIIKNSEGKFDTAYDVIHKAHTEALHDVHEVTDFLNSKRVFVPVGMIESEVVWDKSPNDSVLYEFSVEGRFKEEWTVMDAVKVRKDLTQILPAILRTLGELAAKQ